VAAEATYVYGVIRAGVTPSADSETIGGGALGVVDHDGVAALISHVPDEELEAGREELLTHSRVLEDALGGGAVLPMQFGVVMPSDEVVRSELLERHREELLHQLDQMEGKVELNVKGIYDEPAILREVVAENPEIAELRERISGLPEEATYYERIRIGELVTQALDAKREADAAAVVAALAAHAMASESGPPIHERMAVNASFLVGKDRVDAFDAELERLAKANADRIRFKETGPLPPHSFVELSVGQ
jgi:hypothetical protein